MTRGGAATIAAMEFSVTAQCGTARCGRLTLAHGIVETPVFMPIGTYGTVKAMAPRELEELGAQIILGNAYHLWLRPGLDVIAAHQGLHRFTYSLLPHQGSWRDAEIVRRAYELNAPALAFKSNAGVGHEERTRGTEQSFLRTSCPNILIETVKPAEDGDGLIVRLYETHNQHGQDTITFVTAVVAAQECNLLEEPKAEASYQGNTLHFQVRPFEIKTFRVHLKTM